MKQLHQNLCKISRKEHTVRFPFNETTRLQSVTYYHIKDSTTEAFLEVPRKKRTFPKLFLFFNVAAWNFWLQQKETPQKMFPVSVLEIFREKGLWTFDDDELKMMNCLCGMVDWRKAFILISSRDLTIANLRHTASRVWACAEPEFRLCWMKLCSSDNRCTTALQIYNLKVWKKPLFSKFHGNSREASSLKFLLINLSCPIYHL